MSRTSIVIVTWNSQLVLEECVSSLFRFVPSEDFELFLVDNDSRDRNYLKAYHGRPNITVILNGENLGYAKAVNIGLSQAKGEYYLILNPDTVFISNPLPRLVGELRKNSSVGAIAPLLYGSDGRPQIQGFYPKFPSIMQFILLRSILGKLRFFKNLSVRYLHSRVGTAGIFFVDQIPGAFLLFHRSLVHAKSALNEAYFIWMEDVDFCLNLRKRGLKVAVVSDEKIIHIGGSSFKMWDVSRKKLNFTKSFMTYLVLHHGFVSHFTYGLFMTANAMAITLLFVVARRPSQALERIRLEGKVLGLIWKSLWVRMIS